MTKIRKALFALISSNQNATTRRTDAATAKAILDLVSPKHLTVTLSERNS
jgi:hypothetical protein